MIPPIVDQPNRTMYLFYRTLRNCKELMEMLNGRGPVLAIIFRARDLKTIKMHHEELKKRGEEIEVS